MKEIRKIEKFRKFWVKIPCFSENPNRENHPEKNLQNVVVSARIVLDETGNFIFDTTDESLVNSKLPTKGAYAVLAATAVHLRRMGKNFPSAKPAEMKIQRSESKIEASVDEIKSAIVSLFERDGLEWSQIVTASVEEMREPYVRLEEDEKATLIATAKLITDAKSPSHAEDGKEIYEFSSEDFKFAPNSYWAIWALNNARNDDSKWVYALPRDATYRDGDASAKIAWVRAGSKADKNRPTTSYYGKKTARDYGV